MFRDMNHGLRHQPRLGFVRILNGCDFVRVQFNMWDITDSVPCHVFTGPTLSRRLHEEFSVASRSQNCPTNRTAKARISNALVVFSTHEVNLNTVAGSIEASCNFESDATGDIHVSRMFSLENIAFGEDR